jgi:MoaA/NifB/PqqE/SkfB family radical SAM enzyme
MNYPKSLAIETSTVCNLKCIMCTHSAVNFGRPKIFLPNDIIDKLIPYIEHAESLQLHGIGEPLLSPSFWKVLSHVSKDCWATVNSNFVNVTTDQMENLATSNLKNISVSIDSPNRDTYYIIRGADLDKVIENIKKMISIIKKTESKLFVVLNMTIMKENIDQINETLDLCKKLECFRVDTWPMNNWDSIELDRDIRNFKFSYNDQKPASFKELYNSKIQESVDYSKLINMNFTYNFI